MSNGDHRHSLELDHFLDDALSESMKPVELGNAQREAMRERILSRAAITAPAGTQTIRAGDGKWLELIPLIHMKILRQDVESGNETKLFRLQPGAEFPPHSHTHEEECMVLEGEIEVGGHVVRAGDMHIAGTTHEHPRITSKTGALLLVRSEINELPVT